MYIPGRLRDSDSIRRPSERSIPLFYILLQLLLTIIIVIIIIIISSSSSNNSSSSSILMIIIIIVVIIIIIIIVIINIIIDRTRIRKPLRRSQLLPRLLLSGRFGGARQRWSQ